MRNLYWLAAVFTATMMTSASAASRKPEPFSLSKPAQGFTYFHKAGETLEGHNAALQACYQVAWKFNQPLDANGAGGSMDIGGKLAASIVGGFMDLPDTRANVENCMVVAGWDVVRLEDKAGAEINRLKPPEQAQRLAPLVGSADVTGEVVRRFSNEAADSSARLFDIAEQNRKASLSAGAIPHQAPPPIPLFRFWDDGYIWSNGDQIEKLKQTPPGSALVIVRILSKSDGRIVNFIRTDDPIPEKSDGGPRQQFRLGMSLPMFGRNKAPDRIYAFVVKPGVWAFEGMTRATGSLGVAIQTQFCLGAPGFEVKPDEVVFAGAFDLDGPSNLPDMGLEAVKTALSGLPEAGQRLRAAEYRNGVTFACGGHGYAYALEAPGAAFVDSYKAGSKAQAATLSPAAGSP